MGGGRRVDTSRAQDLAALNIQRNTTIQRQRDQKPRTYLLQAPPEFCPSSGGIGGWDYLDYRYFAGQCVKEQKL